MQAAIPVSRTPGILQWRFEYAERMAVGLVLFISTWMGLHWLPFYGEEWNRTLAASLLLAGFFIPRPAMILATAVILIPMWYQSPTLALWSVFFLWVMSRLAGRRPAQAVWLVATPVFVATGLGFLPLLVQGTYFRSKMGLAVAVAWLASLAIGVWGGWPRFGLVALSGVDPNKLVSVELRSPPANLADLSWIAAPMQDLAKDFRPMVLWLESLTTSPLLLLQVALLMGIAVLSFQATRRTHFLLRRRFHGDHEPVAELLGAEAGAFISALALLSSYYLAIPLVMGGQQTNGGAWVVVAASFAAVSVLIAGRAVAKDPVLLAILGQRCFMMLRTSAAGAASLLTHRGGAAATLGRSASPPVSVVVGAWAQAVSHTMLYPLGMLALLLRGGLSTAHQALRIRPWEKAAVAGMPSIPQATGVPAPQSGDADVLSGHPLAPLAHASTPALLETLPLAATELGAVPLVTFELEEVVETSSYAFELAQPVLEQTRLAEHVGDEIALASIGLSADALLVGEAFSLPDDLSDLNRLAISDECLYSEAFHVLQRPTTYADAWALARWYLKKQRNSTRAKVV